MRIHPIVPASILLLAALAGWGSLREGKAPDPVDRNAPATVFSAERAGDVLQRVLGDERPHPMGSAENRAVRDRILAEFERIGLPAEVHGSFVCGAGSCGTVENILARLPAADGAPDASGVLLTAHYDSVAAGPGAGDDGAGVAAVVEVARALMAGPPLQRDVWFLVDDGEEAGLLGAHAFVQSPEFQRIGWVVNVEARGTVGASGLIETQAGNAGVIAALGEQLPRPSGSSLDYEIYQTLPNDTDFTVYRHHGAGGANFALSRGAARYHTPLDDIAHLSPGSLQHHGDNALGTVRAFAATSDADLQSDTDAAFVHPFGAFQVAWPVSWNPLWLALAILGWALLAWRARRAGLLRWRALLVACLVLPLGWVLVLVPSVLLSMALDALGATPAAWTAQGTVLVFAFLALGVAWAWLAARPLRQRWGDASIALAALLPFLLLATAAVIWMPGASIIVLLPLLAGMLAGHLFPRQVVAWSGVAAVVATIHVFPYAYSGYDAIGRDGLATTPLLAALIALPFLPVVAAMERGARLLAGALLAGCVLAVAIASLRPAFDADSPQSFNLAYIALDGQPGHVVLHGQANASAEWRDAQGFNAETQPVEPWPEASYHLGPQGPAHAAPAVEVTGNQVIGDMRQVTLHVTPATVGDDLLVRLPPGTPKDSVRIQGQPLATSRWPWHSMALHLATPAEGATFAFELPAAEAARIVVIGQTRGLPEQFGEMIEARDAIATPIHGGDRTQAWRAIEVR